MDQVYHILLLVPNQSMSYLIMQKQLQNQETTSIIIVAVMYELQRHAKKRERVINRKNHGESSRKF